MEEKEIELTILMPCLNEAETLGTCIDKANTFLRQNGVSGEVLIADNGSTDGSVQIAESKGARVVHVERKGYGAALTAGWAFDHFRNNLAAQAAGCLLALAVLYAFGTVWLMYQAHLSLANALQAAVLPFIGLDILKIAAAILVGKSVRAALERAHILPVSYS